MLARKASSVNNQIIDQVVSNPYLSLALMVVVSCFLITAFLLKRQRDKEDQFFHIDPS